MKKPFLRRFNPKKHATPFPKEKKFTRANAKKYVLEQLNRGAPPNAYYWTRTAPFGGVYDRLRKSIFFGFRNWRKYLEKEIGVVAMKQQGKYLLPLHPTPQSIKYFVKARLKDGTTLDMGLWGKTPGLRAVYIQLALSNFGGHGTFLNYLKNELYSDYKKRVIDDIRKLAQSEKSMSTTHWQHTPKLAAYYEILRGQNFFGRKNWTGFLQKELELTPVKRSGKYIMPVQLSRRFIESFVRLRAKDTKMNVTTWIKNAGLQRVYRYARSNNYFGHKSWPGFVGHVLTKKQ